MDEKIERLLDEVLVAELEHLKTYGDGTAEKNKALRDVMEIYKNRAEGMRIGFECSNQYEKFLLENDHYEADKAREDLIRKEQLAEQRKDRYIKIGLDAAGVVLPLVFYAVWMNKGFKFEETGTFTSTTFRGLFSRFKPTK